MGMSTYSRLGELKADWDVNQTWEGDNTVLLQQTAKYLFDLYQARMMGKEGKKTIACEWLTVDGVSSVEEARFKGNTLEEMLKDP